MVARRRRKLVAARKAAGYTQEALAEALHVDRSTVQRWEAGHHAPWPYLWPRLARVIGVTRERLQTLLTDNDEPSSPQPVTHGSPTNQAVAWENMKRRTLMKWGVAATTAASASTTVGMSDVKRLQRLLELTIASYARQFARNLAVYRVRLARARLDMGAVDGATEAANAALDDLTGEVASWRVAAELEAVAKRLAAHSNVDGVESFLARYQAVNH
jgi:transcriptional regulator with XRE-family HTH domain